MKIHDVKCQACYGATWNYRLRPVDSDSLWPSGLGEVFMCRRCYVGAFGPEPFPPTAGPYRLTDWDAWRNAPDMVRTRARNILILGE